MEKEYGTIEVLNMLNKNRTLKFKIKLSNGQIGDCDQKIFLDDGNLVGKCSGCEDMKESCGISFNDKWELVPQPVNFMEAVNSGKKIKSEKYCGNYMTVYQLMETFYSMDENKVLEYINGQWYIKED